LFILLGNIQKYVPLLISADVHDPKQYRDIVVELTSFSTLNTYEIRVFKLIMVCNKLLILKIILFVQKMKLNMMSMIEYLWNVLKYIVYLFEA
jgi:hypothetical protein